MLGPLRDFTVRAKEINPIVMVTHCFVHRENLASRRISTKLGNVMQDSIHIVNYIKAKSLNSRLFEKLCVNMNGIFDILHCCE